MDQQQITSLASRIKLVQLNLSDWRAVRRNPAETREVNQRHNTDCAVVSVKLCKCPELSAIHQHLRAVYMYSKQVTLPSCQDGLRVIPLGKELDYVGKLRSHSTKLDALLFSFLPVYEKLRADAPNRLNGLYVPGQWPEGSSLVARFGIHWRILPCPTDGQWSEWLAESAQASQSEFKDRLLQAARHLAAQCKDGNLFQRQFDSLAQLCDLCGQGYNLLEDPVIAEAAARLKPVAISSADAIRESKSAREETALRVNGILQSLNLA